ncbi:MAG: transcription termination factor Rho [Lachnospiraceae bacterium]|jgi:transcription termination factor Rho|nr:transcription termination factor Rho [Lachnospiraceae bacterium]MCI8994246.1 transcription termination factor Rho [Lachnospiraceae bacterium]MCI9135673.1 transcription termination factor Rho [Lachnospiraceae bacterium]
MTKEQYESLPLLELKAIAKSRGMKGLSGAKKIEIVEAMLAKDAEQEERSGQAGEEPQAGARRQPRESGRQAAAGRGQDGAQPGRERRTGGQQNGKERSGSERASGGKDASGTENVSTGREYPGTDSGYGARERYGAEAEPAVRERPAQEGSLDSGQEAHGLLEVMADGFGFIRSANYMPGENDIYVNPAMIRKFNLKTGDILRGNIKVRNQGEKFAALLYIKSINGMRPDDACRRRNFEDLTPIFPDERIHLERSGGSTAMRVVDLISPIGKGQRGMIVSPPKAGKTTLLKDVAKSITRNHPDMKLLILLIDERPEEVTDIKETVAGPNVEVIYSTFDELAEHHKRVSEMVVERAKRLVEHGQDVVILLDSITRLARAYNLVVPPSGRTLSGGLDPAALHMPKRFFGAARNMREGGSLTILATALVETGSKMDDVIYEEFKGTGNMELVLNRKLQEKRVFPAIDIPKSGTRREDLLLNREELEAVEIMRKGINGMKADEAVENILNMFDRTRNNIEFVQTIKKTKIF